MRRFIFIWRRWREERSWLRTVLRARRFRNECIYSARELFDREFAPRIRGGGKIAYPGALYHVSKDDFTRARLFTALHEGLDLGALEGE